MMPTTAEQLIAEHLTAKHNGWTVRAPERLYGMWEAQKAYGRDSRYLVARTSDLLDAKLTAVAVEDCASEQDWDDGSRPAAVWLTSAELFTAAGLILLGLLLIAAVVMLGGAARLMAGAALLAVGAAESQLANSVRLRRRLDERAAARHGDH